MSSEPFHFAEIIGQNTAKRLLQSGLAGKRLGQAFLFRGPVGVGKKSMARIFAARLNCRQPEGSEPCGRCPSCRKYRSGNHPDFLLIEPDGLGIKIDQIRELKKNLAFAPFEAKYRVVLLRSIHTMRWEAANSLLKSLEEPPADTILILTADETGSVPPTILSRCQIVPFFPLPIEQVAGILATEKELDRTVATTLATVANGSLTRARLLHDRGLLPLRLELISTLLAADPDSPKTIRTLTALAESAAAIKSDLPEFFELITTWYHDLQLLAHGLEGKIINPDLHTAFPDACRRWTQAEIATRIELLAGASRELGRNCNPTAVCEVLFFGLL